jgi:hypothetical protein
MSSEIPYSILTFEVVEYGHVSVAVPNLELSLEGATPVPKGEIV